MKTYNELTKEEKEKFGYPEMPEDKKAASAINEFLKFEGRHQIEWLALEKIVHSAEHNVAGRLDALAIIDGKLTLLDFKTSSRISEEYYLQTAGYEMCLKEMGIEVDQRVILRLPKDDESFEAVLVPTDYKEDKEAFLAQRYASQWQSMIEVNHSEDKVVEVKGRKYKNKVLKLTHL